MTAPALTPVEPAAAKALAACTQPLDVGVMASLLAGVDVEAVRETGSTNSDLLVRARVAQPTRPVLRAAVAQSAGRGRHGKRWHTAPGAALLFSVASKWDSVALAPAAVSLACGVAIAETLQAEGIASSLKWPNDVLLEGRKLAGVLCELAADAAGRRTLVVGVGLNLWVDAAMRASIGQPAAGLCERIALAQLAGAREAWIAKLARAVFDAVDVFRRAGFVPWQPRFMQRFAMLGADVDILELGACVARGRALGVDGQGRLLLQTDVGLRTVASGEVSLRAAAGR